MREYLFRGQHEENGKWVYGYYVAADDGKHYIFTGETGLSQAAFGYPLMYMDFVRYEVIPGTVGEFTGMVDRSGKNIFEGDIVKSVNNYGQVVQTGVVDFFDGKFSIKLPDGKHGCFHQNAIWWQNDDPSNWDEVIGNIHDTPELSGGEGKEAQNG
jgi:uncharacterized phage protein (TIGR01671 family)